MMLFCRELNGAENFYLNDLREAELTACCILIYNVRQESLPDFRQSKQAKSSWQINFRQTFSHHFEMLRKFLWRFPLRNGAFTVAVSGILLSALSMVLDIKFLRTAAMNQGNFAYRLAYLVSSVLLLIAARDVRVHLTI